MKVLFLDVDGVLNNEEVFVSRRYGAAPVCPECCGRLFRLLDATGAKVVLSSSWRGIPNLERRLRDRGVFRYVHKDKRTGHLSINSDTRRGQEIAEWLSRHPEVKRYAIVDDDSDMLPEQQQFFVQTDFKTGLLDEHVTQLAVILDAKQ